MNKIVVFFLLFLNTIIAQNQNDSLVFSLHFKWKNEVLMLNKNYISRNDTLQINLLKFYISNIEINYADGTFYKEKNSYHLVDIEDLNTTIFNVSKNENKAISKINFNIGIDQKTNNSGALSGDLDATKGMYWAWQSGYINMKIEGKSNSCKTRKNVFQFHIGGYLDPFYALRNITLNGNFNSQNKIDLVIDLEKLFSEINLSETNSVMIPSQKAMQIADLSTKIFMVE